MPDAFICDGVRTPIGRYAGGAHDLPVGAAGHDLALEPRALDGAAEDVDDPPLATGRLAKPLDAAERGVERARNRSDHFP